MKKILALLLATVLTLGGLVGLLGMGVSAAAAPTVAISTYNVSFRDALCLKFSVSVKNTTAVPQFLYWTSPAEVYDHSTAEGVLETVGYDENGRFVFDYTGLAARQMGDEIYGRPFVVVDGVTYYGAVKKASIMEYAYTILGKFGNTGFSQELMDMMEPMLEYGAMAQLYCDNYRADRLVNEEYYRIVVQNGTVDDGLNKGMYREGDTVSLIANAANFSHWETSDGRFLSASPVTSVIAVKGNETYVAVTKSAATAKVAFLDKDGGVISTVTPVNGTVTAPAAPTVKGYTFVGWDGNGDGVADADALNGITAGKNLKAVYEAVSNQIYFAYTETDDALTVTATVTGNVRFAGVDMTVAVTGTGLASPTVEAHGATVANVGNDGAVRASLVNVSDVTGETVLYTLTFAKTGGDVSLTLNVTADMFDQNDQTVSFGVANNAY